MTEAGVGSNVLKFTELTIMENEKCQDAWERGDTMGDMEITGNMICAWHSSGSACNGDSGGPLSCQPGIPCHAYLDEAATLVNISAHFLFCLNTNITVEYGSSYDH